MRYPFQLVAVELRSMVGCLSGPKYSKPERARLWPRIPCHLGLAPSRDGLRRLAHLVGIGVPKQLKIAGVFVFVVENKFSWYGHCRNPPQPQRTGVSPTLATIGAGEERVNMEKEQTSSCHLGRDLHRFHGERKSCYPLPAAQLR